MLPRAALALAAAGLLLGCPRDDDGPAAGGAGTPRTAFDGRKAYADVRDQLAFGPRVPGTQGHRRAGDWMLARLRAAADTVIVQEWTHVTAGGDSLPMRNLLARFRPADTDRVLYLAHWDTRPIADGETDPARRALPIPGANDGASGVAILLGVADALKQAPPPTGVDLLLVDGEDYGSFDRDEDVFIGSRWFADHLPSPGYQPMFGVLWDMVGDRDLQLYHEGHSMSAAPEVVQRVWREAESLGYARWFVPRAKYTVDDDHLALIEKGLRVIDVIDFDYPHHHKLSDGLDKVSAGSLQIVGDVALSLLR